MTWKRAAPAGGVLGEMGRVGGESRGALAGPLPENRRREGGGLGSGPSRGDALWEVAERKHREDGTAAVRSRSVGEGNIYGVQGRD